MATKITVNQNNGTLVLQANTAGFVNLGTGVAGTSKASNAGETVTGMTIREVFWTQKDGNVSANTWLIKRGANTVLVCPGNSGHFKFDGMQIENSFEKASNVNFVTTGLGTLILKLKKTSGEV